MTLESRTFRTARQTTRYLECGPATGPLMVFVHGWPGLGLMWRAQLEDLAADGWRCIAPDLRGFGGSSAPGGPESASMENIVADMLELLGHLGTTSAVWVGHDWGSVVVGQLAAHEPHACRAAVLTSWAYQPGGTGLATLVPLVDRSVHPADEYPDGQWDYYRYYTTHFDEAVADLDADPASTLASVYRSGSPDAVGRVSPSATVTRNGGRFGAAHRAPRTEPDPALWPAADFEEVVAAYRDRGFGPPSRLYVNDEANVAYARRSPDGGRLAQPVLFVNGEWDALCTITGNRQGDPMRAACADLTIVSVDAGHWLPLERATELTEALRAWVTSRGLHPSP
ncbi:alpha/beta fold hydrolase [Jatrophihabitans sp. YIM 134969]